MLHSICQQIWKSQQWPQDWKRSVFIPIPKKDNAKECSNYHPTALISHTSKVMLKIIQARLQQYTNWDISNVQLDLEKAEEPEIKLPISTGLMKKHKNSRRTSTSVSLTTLKPLCKSSHSVVCNSLRPHELQHARPPCPSPTPRVYSNSCSSSQWCHPAISSSVVPFFSCPQSIPASGSILMSQLLAWGGQSTGVSALASVLPMNTQDWSPLGWTGWISLQSKGLSRVFSNTTVQKHQFFSAPLSS